MSINTSTLHRAIVGGLVVAAATFAATPAPAAQKIPGAAEGRRPEL